MSFSMYQQREAKEELLKHWLILESNVFGHWSHRKLQVRYRSVALSDTLWAAMICATPATTATRLSMTLKLQSQTQGVKFTPDTLRVFRYNGLHNAWIVKETLFCYDLLARRLRCFKEMKKFDLWNLRSFGMWTPWELSFTRTRRLPWCFSSEAVLLTPTHKPDLLSFQLFKACVSVIRKSNLCVNIWRVSVLLLWHEPNASFETFNCAVPGTDPCFTKQNK